MLPVAPGGTGQPPSSPMLDSNESQPACSAGQHVGQALAARVVEVRGQLDVVAERRARRSEVLADLQRVGHPGRVAEGDLLRARVGQPRRDLEHALARDDALVGAAEARRDHGLDAQAGVAGAGDDALEAVQRRRDRAVDVAEVVRLGGRQEDADLLEVVAQLERVVQAARVRHEHAARDARAGRRSPPAPRARRTSCGMTSRAHEARDLDPPQRRCARAGRPARPCPRSRRSRARSAGRRAGRPRGCCTAIGSLYAPSPRAITICWISSVPSPIVRIFASRYMRHTGYSSM